MSTESSPDLVDGVLGEITAVLARVSRVELGDLASRLDGAERVFVVGAGRSGFLARAFAMRLMHLGLSAYVVGETTTPAFGARDAVVGVSGSGTTADTVRVAEQAVAAGATVHVVTTDPVSPLAELADVVLTVPAAAGHQLVDAVPTVQLLASLFDQTAFVLLDVVCLDLGRRRGVDNSEAEARHA